jgi:hypothetical protein
MISIEHDKENIEAGSFNVQYSEYEGSDQKYPAIIETSK